MFKQIQKPLTKFQRILFYLKPVINISMEAIVTSNLEWSFFFRFSSSKRFMIFRY